MTEFQELIQDAPNFVSMERGELVAYAYGMFAAGTKANAENAKLRELCKDMWSYINAPVNQRNSLKERLAIYDDFADIMRELGVEASE